MCAPISPRNNPSQIRARSNSHQWATGVSLARVATSLLESSAEHRGQDVLLGVHLLANSIGHRWQLDPLENSSERTALSGGAPSGDDDVGGGLLVLLWELDRLDERGVNEWVRSGDEEERDVVGESVAVVLGVDGDLCDLLPLFIRSSLGSVVFASDDLDGCGRVAFDAMGSGDSEVWGDD